MASSKKSEGLKIINFSIPGPCAHNQTIYLQGDLIPYIDDFVNRGIFASKSEFFRVAAREKIIKLLDEDAILTKWREEISFNKTHNEKVRVQGKEYNIVRRCE